MVEPHDSPTVMGMPLATAAGLAAVLLIAALLLRARSLAPPATPLGRVARSAHLPFADLADSEAGRRSQRFLAAEVLPRFKPVLLRLLRLLEKQVDPGFRGAERAIKRL